MPANADAQPLGGSGDGPCLRDRGRARRVHHRAVRLGRRPRPRAGGAIALGPGGGDVHRQLRRAEPDRGGAGPGGDRPRSFEIRPPWCGSILEIPRPGRGRPWTVETRASEPSARPTRGARSTGRDGPSRTGPVARTRPGTLGPRRDPGGERPAGTRSRRSDRGASGRPRSAGRSPISSCPSRSAVVVLHAVDAWARRAGGRGGVAASCSVRLVALVALGGALAAAWGRFPVVRRAGRSRSPWSLCGVGGRRRDHAAVGRARGSRATS